MQFATLPIPFLATHQNPQLCQQQTSAAKLPTGHLRLAEPQVTQNRKLFCRFFELNWKWNGSAKDNAA